MKRIWISILVLAFAHSCFAAPTVHQAALTFTQSTTAGITSNCVYRGTVSGGPYTQIFCSTAPISSYTDTAVTQGATYYYVVTALVGTNESQYSIEAHGTVPTSPNAPTGVVIIFQ